jgi:pyridoxine kinase
VPICDKWQDEGVEFDAIYTGYLGSIEQIEMMKDLFAKFGSGDDKLVFVDPVMADNGKLYPAFDMDYARKNTELCAHADMIVPNITEACIMTGTEYREEHDEEYIKGLLSKVVNLGARISVLTGVSLSEGKTGIMGYDRKNDEFYVYQNDKIGAMFHGTGDLFSSTVIGEIMHGKDWKDAMRIAADYTAYTIKATMEDPKKPWYGVNFEETIPHLITME